MISHACVPLVVLKPTHSSRKATYTLQRLNFTGIKKENYLTGKMDMKRFSKSRNSSTQCINGVTMTFGGYCQWHTQCSWRSLESNCAYQESQKEAWQKL